MSFDDVVPLGFARSLGRLQLRVDELEEGGAGGDPAEARRLRIALDEAGAREAKALALLGEERKLRVQAEEKLTRAFARIAAIEKRASRDPDDAQSTAKLREQVASQSARQVEDAGIINGLKLAVADLEAKLRGKDQALSEAARKLAAADQRVRGLEAYREHARPTAVPDCPVCSAIKHMVLGVKNPATPAPPPVSTGTIDPSPAPTAASPEPRPRSVTVGRNQTAPGAILGIATAVRDVLRKAERPLSCREIAERTGIPTTKITTNVPNMRRNQEVVRFGVPAIGGGSGGYVYWLKARPLPEGFKA